jgi:hypothetical protein
MLTWNRLEAGGSKLEANGMVSVFLSLKPPASGFKLMSVLADDLMLVFRQPADAAVGAV